MDESRPVQSQPAAREPYGLGRMLEDTVSSLFQAGDVFADLAGKPAPSYEVMIPNLLVFCAAVCAATLLRACVATPGLLYASPSTMAIAAAGGLILAVPLSFLTAGVLHAFMLLSGGEGDYQRSYQASSMFSILIALQALLNWFDWVWMLPALLAAYMGTAAARTLHRAPALRAGVVFCLVAAFGIVGQWAVREQVSRWSQTARAMQTTATAVQDLSIQLQRMQQMSAPQEPGIGGTGRGAPEALGTGPGPAAPQNSPQPIGLSSLELLSPPQGDNQSDLPAQLQAQAQAQTRTIQQTTTDLLAPIMGMLKNPALTRGMPPEQAKQIGAITDMLVQMQKDMAGGKTITPEERSAMMARFQGTMMQMMTQMQQQGPLPRRGRILEPARKTAKPSRTPPAPRPDAGNPTKSGAGGPQQEPASRESPEKTPE
ncbi:MAG: Yip1 family protein [Elusimicrobia bacterium]|nr:Yip1 family protein [Elusimicrobiota bacterium]